MWPRLHTCCAKMKCEERVLNYASLAFGLLSFGALSLAVATDYWLVTNEQVDPRDMMDPDEKEEYDAMMEDIDLTMMDNVTMYAMPTNVPINIHSGLWRACVFYLDDMDANVMGTICANIGYHTGTWERLQGGDTTNSILRAIRKSAPSIVISLFILVFAVGFSTVGNNKNNNKTVIGAVLYTFSALSLAVGVIFYISAVNDEVSHRKPPSNPKDPEFQYRYGWAFFFAGSSFVFSLICAVTNISVYLRRYSNLEDMVIIIPGLNKQGQMPVSSSRDMEESDYDYGGAQNPTIIL